MSVTFMDAASYVIGATLLHLYLFPLPYSEWLVGYDSDSLLGGCMLINACWADFSQMVSPQERRPESGHG